MHSVQIAVRRGGCVVDSVIGRRDGYRGKWGGRREVLISWSNLISMCYGNAIGGIGQEWSSLPSLSLNSALNQLIIHPQQRIGTSFMDLEMTINSFHFLHPCIPFLSSYPTPLPKGANDIIHPISCQQPQRLILKHTPHSISIHRKSTMRTETREKNRGFLRMCGEIRIRDCFHHNRISSAA